MALEEEAEQGKAERGSAQRLSKEVFQGSENTRQAARMEVR